MYTFVLAEGDGAVRDSLLREMEWERFGLVCLGAYGDGGEAYRKVRADPPDIVVTGMDLRGMNGLELIRRTQSEFSDMKVVVLSGSDDFALTSQIEAITEAHYVLKPCGVKTVGRVLRNVVKELDEREDDRRFVRETESRLERSEPHRQEQFLRDLLLGRPFSPEEWTYLKRLLRWDGRRQRLVLIQLAGSFDAVRSFLLRRVAEELLGDIAPQPHAVMFGSRLVLFVPDIGDDPIVMRLYRVKERYARYASEEMSISLSRGGQPEQLRRLYAEADHYLSSRYYLGEGCIITPKDIPHVDGGNPEDGIAVRSEKLSHAIRSGKLEEAGDDLISFLKALDTADCEEERRIAYGLELLLLLARQAPAVELGDYVKKAVSIAHTGGWEELRAYLRQAAAQIAGSRDEVRTRNRQELVERMIRLVHEHIADEQLSLMWLSKEKLFLSMDYAGKLFKRETGEKFTQYVLRVRMEKAAEWFRASGDIGVNEVAERTGYGENTPYFRQVFKKYFGCSPKEYRVRYRSDDEDAARPSETGTPDFERPTAPTAGREGGSGKITLRMTISTGSWIAYARKKRVIDMFEQRYPHIRIKPEFFSSWSKRIENLKDQAAANSMPDLVFCTCRSLVQLASGGLLHPLDDVVRNGTLRLADVPSALLEHGKYAGKLYGVGIGVNALSVIYDPDKFDWADMEQPDAKWTWERYERDMVHIHNRLGVHGDDYQTVLALELFLRENGQSLFHPDGRGIGFEKRLAVEFLERMVRMNETEAMFPLQKSMRMRRDPFAAFVNGEQSLVVAWSNMLEMYRRLSGKHLEIGLPPGVGGGRSLYVHPSQLLAVSGSSRYPEEAAQFIDYWVNAPEVSAVLKGSSGLPVSSKVLGLLAPRLDRTEKQIFDYMREAARFASPLDRPDPDGAEQIRLLLGGANRLVVCGQITAGEAMEQFISQAERMFDKQNGYP